MSRVFILFRRREKLAEKVTVPGRDQQGSLSKIYCLQTETATGMLQMSVI